MGILKRLGIVFGVILIFAAYLVAWLLALAWAAVGIIPALIGWIVTGTYHDPMYFLELLVDGDPI